MIKEQGLSVQHVCESMSIGPTAVRRWIEQYDAEQSDHLRADWRRLAVPGGGDRPVLAQGGWLGYGTEHAGQAGL
jgi:hypothetical protein